MSQNIVNKLETLKENTYNVLWGRHILKISMKFQKFDVTTGWSFRVSLAPQTMPLFAREVSSRSQRWSQGKKSCEIIAAFTGSMYLKLKSQCFWVQELEFSQRFPTRLKLELQEFELFCNFQFLSFDALNCCSHTYLEVNNHMMTIWDGF